MTLEDFFTLTEMKDGLSTLPRVEELVSAMKEQKDSVLNNGTEAARQWSAVVGTLAATDNKDCLNQFINLNGLSFLNQWLQESEKSDEGLIIGLLALLEKLPVDGENLSVSEIGITIDRLLDHKNLDIREKAKKLADKWNTARINHVSDQPTPSADINTNNVSLDRGEAGGTNCEVKSMGAESHLSNSSQVDTTNDVNSLGSSLVTEEVDASKKEGSPCNSSGLSASLPNTSVEDQKQSGLETVIPNASEEIDAMEVARQVALEVEREVVHYREPFCSSPEANSAETMDAPTPEAKQELSLIQDLDSNMVPGEKDVLPDSQEHKQPLESPKASPRVWDFDLNEDICTEEFNCSADPVSSLSAPKAVVATLRGDPSLRIPPLQFGGEMGWKGSAATSAFRPASPRRTPDQKQNFLEIDLNVVGESECDDVAVDPPASLPSGDSSMEVSSKRAEKLLKLDLNRLGDEDLPVNWRLHQHNGDQSLSSASSSSPRQPPMRDFDLNDNPCFLDAGGSSSSLNEPAIQIMGSRMGVERKDYMTQAHQSFMSMPYAHMPSYYGYGGHPAGPAIPIYGSGSIPYMMDSRGGTPMLPFLGGGAPLSMNGAGPSRSGFDLNSCMTSVESGSREGGSFTQQQFIHVHNGLMEEHTRVSSQPSSLVVSLKRKEPECGWEPCAVGYKRMTSWQ